MTFRAPYKVGSLSRITGLSPVLLRAWERRYGLLHPERGPGGQRLYTDRDRAVLQKTQELLTTGRSIGEIAALGREALLSGTPNPLWASGPSEPTETTFNPTHRYRAGIVKAALNLDEEGLKKELDKAAASLSLPVLIEGVIEAAAREIGDLWQAGKCTVASEHLASIIFVHRLRKLIDSAESLQDLKSPLVIAACLPGEEHQLGLLILSYFLNCQGVRVLYLGTSLPLADLVHACHASRPLAVLLSVTRAQMFRKNREEIRNLPKLFGRDVNFYLGGAGAPDGDFELEEAGIKVSPRTESASRAANRIAQELRIISRNRKARRPGAR